MNLVFCGTPEFAVPTLRKLATDFTVKLAISQPDRPSGRGMEIAAPPVKQLAQTLGIPVVQPEKIKANEELRAQLTALKPDAIIVVAYGCIIPQWMLDLPRLGNINLHASLLPKYRGAAPIQWAIANGESSTGVTTMRIDAGLDTGPILLRREVAILPDETSVTLAARLAAIGAELMGETLCQFDGGSITPQPQDNSQATLAPLLKKEDGRIDFLRNAREIYNQFRGFQPWPGAYTTFRGRNVRILRMNVSGAIEDASPGPGGIVFRNHSMLVACGNNTAIEVLELQPESRKPISSTEFAHGTRLEPSDHFGD